MNTPMHPRARLHPDNQTKTKQQKTKKQKRKKGGKW